MNNIYLKHFIIQQFEILLQIQINSPDILISFAHFMYSQLRNSPMAYTYLSKAKSKNIGLQHSFIIYRYM